MSKDDKADKSAAATSEDGSATKEECSGDSCGQTTEKRTYGKLGLADHCKYEPKDSQGCFTCAPRDLPIVKCVDVDGNFDPAKACEYDLDMMSCIVQDGQTAFEFDFDEPSQMETIYNKIPLFLLGAKVLIGGKLKDDPVAKELLFSSFDSVLAHKKEIFNGNVSPLIDEVAGHVKKAKPDIADEKVQQVKDGLKKACDELALSYADGKMDDKDFLQFALAVVSAMPPELIGNVADQLDIEKVVASLGASGSKDIITDIMTNANVSQTPEEGSGAED